jgi:hypothetical protein
MIVQQPAPSLAVTAKVGKDPRYRSFLRGVKGVNGQDDPTKMIMLPGATLVPPTDANGVIAGGGSPYGTVVQGHVYSGNELTQGRPVNLSALNGRLLGNTRTQKQVAHVDGGDLDEEQISAICSRPLKQPPPPSVEQAVQANSQVLAALEEQLSRPAPERPKVVVELEGVFGRARLNCLGVERHENMLVLVQSQADNVFQPPASETSCKITCQAPGGAWSLKAFAVGLAFPIEAMDIFVQVFLLES